MGSTSAKAQIDFYKSVSDASYILSADREFQRKTLSLDADTFVEKMLAIEVFLPVKKTCLPKAFAARIDSTLRTIDKVLNLIW